MTYNALIERIRSRGFKFLENTPSYDSSVVYVAINDAIRDIANTAKDVQITPATLTLVAGTRDYTISSAIGADVGDILTIWLDTVEIRPLSVDDLQEEIHDDVYDEDDVWTTDVTTGTPVWYRVWNGVMRIYPTPSVAASATVYYTKKVVSADYSTNNGTATVPVKDEYLSALIYLSLAYLLEQEGMTELVDRYRGIGTQMMNEVMSNRSHDDNEGEIEYHNSVDV